MTRALPVLMYHHVSHAPGLVTVSPETFREQLGALARSGWHTVTCAELEAFLAGGSLPEKSVMLTFDDGYLDNYVYAYPVLKEFGMHATVFLVSNWIAEGVPRATGVCPDHRECKRRIAAGDSDSVILRWSEIREMQDSGLVEFQSHTHTHTRWDQQLLNGDARRAAMRDEMQTSREVLESGLGRAISHLCWPQGYYQEDYIPLAEQIGYRYLYTTQRGTNHSSGDRLRIKRIVAKEKDGRWLLKRLGVYASPILAGIYGLFKKS